MVEQNDSYLAKRNEAGLTKKTLARTLKSKANSSMEEDKEDIRVISKKIKDIARERQRRGVSADEATAAKAVWQTMIGRNLTSEEAKKGSPLKEGREPTKEEIETVEKVVNDPKKYEKFIDSSKNYNTELLKKTFSGDMGKIMVAVLGEGIVEDRNYLIQLDDILEKSANKNKDIADLIHTIEADVKKQREINRQEHTENSLQTVEGDISPEEMQKAKAAWDEQNRRARLEGREVTQRELDDQAYATKKGWGPSRSANGDNLFANLDYEQFKNDEIQRLALDLRIAGEQGKVDARTIQAIKERGQALINNNKISQAEYMEFAQHINPMLAEFQAKQQGEQQAAKSAREVGSGAGSSERMPQYIDSALEELAGMERIDDPEVLRSQMFQYFEKFGEQVMADLQYKFGADGADDYLAEWDQLANANSPQKVREFLQRMKNTPVPKEEEAADSKEGKKSKKIAFNSVREKGEEEGWLTKEMFGTEPRSIQDLAKWIMVTDDSRLWSPYAKDAYPLFDLKGLGVGEVIRDKEGNIKYDEEGNERMKFRNYETTFRPENFIRWLRNKMLELHNDNPDDPLSPLTAVAIRTLYSPVSILQMKYDKQRYFSDPQTGEILDSLYNQVINEAWIFGVRRNYDLMYRQAMFSDEKLVETIQGINQKNEHTKSDNLEFVMSLPDNFSLDKDKTDNNVGQGILLASQIYKNLPDWDSLRHLLPDDSPIFTYQGFVDAVKILEQKGQWEDVKSYGDLIFEKGENGRGKVTVMDVATGQPKVLIDFDGKVNRKYFIDYMNIFVTPNPAETRAKMLRELVKAAIAKELAFDMGINYPPSKEEWEKAQAEARSSTPPRHISMNLFRNAKRINLDFAEVNAFIEQRWNGQAARNDTGYRGYDAATKTIATQKYRERQSGDTTAGPIGNRHDIPIFRNLTPEMWTAIKTEKGKIVQQIFEDIVKKGKEIRAYEKQNPSDKEGLKRLKEEQKQLYSDLRFPQLTQLDWSNNQVKRGWEVWHDILGSEDLGFDKLVTRNIWGDPQYNDGEFHKVIRDGFIKKRRYAFASNNVLDYGANKRVFVCMYQKDDPRGEGYTQDEDLLNTPYFKDMTVAEDMFGDVVTKPLRKDFDEGKLKYKTWDPNAKEGKGDLVTLTSKNGGDWDKYLSSSEARTRLLKNVCRAGLAAQIKAHRETHGTTTRWNRQVVNNFIDSLTTLQAVKQNSKTGDEDFETDENGNVKSFFSKEDLDWIRKEAGVEQWKLLMEESAMTGGEMLLGLPGIFAVLTKGLVDF